MTDAELDELLQDCPVLYHMTEEGSWPSIRDHGLLSTSAVLDRFGLAGSARRALESERRMERVTLGHSCRETFTLRDQKPMDDAGLLRCLDDGLRPEDWYRLLNGRVFFWLSQSRLLALSAARSYRFQTHEVLEIDAAALVRAYASAITLSPINSGATRPFPQRRGLSTFRSIADYDYAYWRSRRPRRARVVELTVSRGVPDIARFVRGVTKIRDAEFVGRVF